MSATTGRLYARLLGSASAITLISASAAFAEPATFSIAPQPLALAVGAFSEQSGRPVLLKPELADQLKSGGVIGSLEPEIALAQMLSGTGLSYRRSGDAFLIVKADTGPQSGSAAGDGAEVEALIVTAQKREEDIQDVPIAISAFTQEQLDRSQVAGGPDLMTQVPNFTFTKTNFSSYSIQIRGIGTQAISATTDAAVAIAFNNTAFIRNRFFEQEFYDLQRVEVLRGPQGTLYGRNATAGVVNIISQKPKFAYEARVSGDLANYNSSRLEGMINLPLVEHIVALRLAGAWTRREGYATNQLTGEQIDGRDLWSSRLSLRFAPTERLDATLIWEHFAENDDRLRSGKQLCKTYEATQVGTITIDRSSNWVNPGNALLFSRPSATFSQGCEPSSLYSPDSFQTPNGLSIPYYLPLGAIFLPTALDDPYVSRFQSHDLRVIESTVEPDYRAKTELAELQVNFDLTENLTLSSETGYLSDFVFSKQDFNRFNTAPGAWRNELGGFDDREGVLLPGPNGGIFCDPQLGCSDRMVAVDLSTARSRHFSQEFRLGSNYEGAFNFSLGANFLRYDTTEKYYVFVNSLSLLAAISPFASANGETLPPYVGGVTTNRECMPNGLIEPDMSKIQPVGNCVYMDTNPIDDLSDLGHNYFLSKNPYKLISYAVFGEAYYNVTDALKVTAGLRWTVDRKEAPRIPSWVLAGDSFGYPVANTINQEWREPTGRLTIDWKPELPFTDETLLYASLAHGYKAGGANPPPTGPVKYCIGCGSDSGEFENLVVKKSATHPTTFEAEFVNAFEVGSKNTMLDGSLTLNLAAFYYDYTGYQISQIVNRSAVNLNFDAKVWGLEIEADWRPLENLRLGFKGGYENTRVADGMRAVDLMDRTAGDPNYIVVKPFPTFPSNCILPVSLFDRNGELYKVGNVGGGGSGGCEIAYVLGLDPLTEEPYDPDVVVPGYPEYHGFDPSDPYINNGEGIYKDLSGNDLPNAPNFTATITADYTIPMPNDWLATLHTDLYYQSEAWTRIFNTPGYDKLKAYTNVNLAAIFTNEAAGWKVMAYVKNVFDRDSITGAFLNSDDTGLTTNVFLTEPRLYGMRVTKEWAGGPWWTGANPNHPAGEPYPLTVTVEGQVQRHDAPYSPIAPTLGEDFSPGLSPIDLQNQDLDWGDGRSVAVAFRPGGAWQLGANWRFSETNATNRLIENEAAGRTCWFAQASCEYFYQFYGDQIYFTGPNYVVAEARNREEHTILEFTAGRDVGLGLRGGASVVSAGIRNANLKSGTQLKLLGIPDWQLPEEFAFFQPSTHHLVEGDFRAQREFNGWGPELAWEASAMLWGDDARGHLDVDWSVTGGVLFGKQEATFAGSGESRYFSGGKYGYAQRTNQVGPTEVTEAPASRSNSANVPFADLTLGLAYEVQRVKIGAGYRWERYFDAVDAGFETEQTQDRTIDGPYIKLSVGFGG